MLIMYISQICSLINVCKNKIYETLIDKTLYECVLLITNLFSNILIFLQHLVISYITSLNTGTLVIKKYAHSEKCAHVCTNTQTHTHSPLITQLYTTFISIRGLRCFSVGFDTRHASYSWENKNTQYYQYWEHTHQHKYILFSDWYVHLLKRLFIFVPYMSWRHREGLEVKLSSVSTSTLDGGVSCHHAPATLPWERTLMPIKVEAAMASKPVWTCLEVTKVHPTGIQTLVSTDHNLVALQTMIPWPRILLCSSINPLLHI